MELTEKKCTEISKKANNFIKMYSEQINDHNVRDNFLEIANYSFDNDDDMNLFKCFVIFHDPKQFLIDYKENNKDLKQIASIYHTNENIVELFLEVFKKFSSNPNRKPTKQNIRNKKLSIIEENKILRKRVLELESLLNQNENKSQIVK